jgi:3-deoxy-manno-octulosonate cytidylyltransferase (CMP-KDO synthetase)
VNPVVVIPARMAATRLPDKPLADIGGLPMIVRALRQAAAANVGPVIVAAGDQAIVEAVEAAGGNAILTDPELPSGTDRVRAALDIYDPDEIHDVVINLQGDMPFVSATVLAAAVGLFASRPDLLMGTLIAPEASPADRSNPDTVKAIVALEPGASQGRCLYFTRSTLYGEGPVWKHVGLYGYRREGLRKMMAPPSPLEQREKLEQLRALEMGMEIWAAVIDETPMSVDNPADLAAARKYAETHS